MFVTPVFWMIVLPTLGTTFGLLRLYKYLQDQAEQEDKKMAKAPIPIERRDRRSR